MRIAVDAEALAGQRSGVGRYTLGLLRGIVTASSSTHLHFVLPRSGQPLASVMDVARSLDASSTTPGRLAWRLVRYGNLLGLPTSYRWFAPDADVFLFPNYRDYRTAPKPHVTMLYDLSFLDAPETIEPSYLRRLRLYVERAVSNSAAIGVISRTMAREIEDRYPQIAGRTALLYPGPSLDLADEPPPSWQDDLGGLGLRPGYFLFVGNVEPRKNLVRLLDGFERFHAGGSDDRRLVLVGPPGWRNAAIHERLEKLGSRVALLPYQDDTTLRSLYEGARALVFPSVYEGFGLPVLEAMRTGTPVVCSDIPVLREVAGDAALYFDPYDPVSIADALAVATGGDLSDLVNAGRERTDLFSWDRTGEAAVQLFRRLA